MRPKVGARVLLTAPTTPGGQDEEMQGTVTRVYTHSYSVRADRPVYLDNGMVGVDVLMFGEPRLVDGGDL